MEGSGTGEDLPPGFLESEYMLEAQRRRLEAQERRKKHRSPATTSLLQHPQRLVQPSPHQPPQRLVQPSPQQPPQQLVQSQQQLVESIHGPLSNRASPVVQPPTESSIVSMNSAPTTATPPRLGLPVLLGDSAQLRSHSPVAVVAEQQHAFSTPSFDALHGLPCHASGTMRSSNEQPLTVALADVESSPVHSASTIDSEPLNLAAIPEDENDGSRLIGRMLESGDKLRNYEIVTLPLHRSALKQYDSILIDRMDVMDAFGDLYKKQNGDQLPEKLVARMDSIFQKLNNLCDLPFADESISDFPAEQRTRFYVDVNAKMHFVYEFLHLIRDLKRKVLVLCAPGPVYNHLHTLLSTLNLSRYIWLGKDQHVNCEVQGLSVTLASTDQNLDFIEAATDIVISYDQSAKSARLPPGLSFADGGGPLNIWPVSFATIEHIGLKLQQNLTDLDRKAALSYTLIAVLTMQTQKLRKIAHHHPEDVALAFNKALRASETFLGYYKPLDLPQELFNVFVATEVATLQVVAAREPRTAKRDLRACEDEEDEPKRPRLAAVTRPHWLNSQMSDLLKKTFRKYTGKAQLVAYQEVLVPLVALEHMASRIDALEKRIRDAQRKENTIREDADAWSRSIKEWEETLRNLDQDRRKLGKENDDAWRELKDTQKRLEATEEDNEKLEKQVLRLRTSLEAARSQVNGKRESFVECPDCDKHRAEARDWRQKHGQLIKENEWFRERYQNASKRAAELAKFEKQNNGLREQIKVHKINHESAMKQCEKQRDDARSERDGIQQALQKARKELGEVRKIAVERSNGRRGLVQGRMGRGRTNWERPADQSRGASPISDSGSGSNIGTRTPTRRR